MLEVLIAEDFKTARFPAIHDLDVRKVLYDSVNETADRVASQAYVTATFAPVFGATALCPRYEPFPFGMQRKNDLCVLTHVVNQLAQKRNGEPVTVLELAAGRSYGDSYHHGAPWLSRIMKLALGRFADITVTDRCAADVNALAVDQQKVLYSICLNRFARNCHGIIPFSAAAVMEPSHQLQFHGKTAEELERRFPAFAEIFHSVLSAELAEPFLEKSRRALNRQTRFFIRPALDANFESSIYGLKVRNDVDITRVTDYFAPRSFDVIFARHMAPTPFRSKNPLILAAEELVKPTGVVLLG